MTEPRRGEDRMVLLVNGEERSLAEGSTIAQLLSELGLVPGAVVVERNREIVERRSYDDVRLEEGDRIELVHFVGGG